MSTVFDIMTYYNGKIYNKTMRQNVLNLHDHNRSYGILASRISQCFL